MHFTINETALQAVRSPQPDYNWEGHNPFNWANHIVDKTYSGFFRHRTSNERINWNRQLVSEFLADRNVAPEDAFIAICAWGKMRHDHGRRAWSKKNGWLGTIERLRRSHLQPETRSQTYEIFRELRKAGQLPGVGPAYFTKIMFFLRPDLNAYILDQWTSRSINLLYPEESLIRLGPSNNVLDSNSGETYEIFCLKIEDLAKRIGRTSIETEKIIFGGGGKNPAPWRKYVVANS